MLWTCLWFMATYIGGHDGKEPTDRLVPAGWKGNPWGPAANEARKAGRIPPVPMTHDMRRWDAWGRKTLRDGDLLFRRGDARLLFGYFPFSRFLANVDNSPYSHTGILAIEDGDPVVYDTTKAGVRRQPFCVWILDNAGPFGVRRLKAERRAAIPAVLAFLREVYVRQAPFDYDLGLDDQAFYCIEMSEKAFRAAGIPLSEPVLLGDMERAAEFPVCIFVFSRVSNLTLDHPAFFPGNERHGLWSSPDMETVYASGSPTVAAAGMGPEAGADGTRQ